MMNKRYIENLGDRLLSMLMNGQVQVKGKKY